MTINILEKYGTGQAESGGDKQFQITSLFIVDGSNDLATALSEFEADVDADYGGLDFDHVAVDLAHEEGDGTITWQGIAFYKTRPRAVFEAGDNFYSFDTGGGTAHITHSLSTTATYNAAGHSTTNHKNAINVHEGNIGGLDVGIPAYEWQETHYFADATVSDAYIGKLYALAWHVNSDNFAIRNGSATNFPAGSVIFKGASGGQREEGDWEITFAFSYSQNRTGLSVGDIAAIAKKGWEWLWIETKPTPDGGRMRQKAVQANVEQVYYTGAFADLGIR